MRLLLPPGMIRLAGKDMRLFQIIAFCFGVAAFLVSACFTETATGETLWKVGVAIMIGDIVCILLWPSPKQSKAVAP